VATFGICIAHACGPACAAHFLLGYDLRRRPSLQISVVVPSFDARCSWSCSALEKTTSRMYAFLDPWPLKDETLVREIRSENVHRPAFGLAPAFAVYCTSPTRMGQVSLWRRRCSCLALEKPTCTSRSKSLINTDVGSGRCETVWGRRGQRQRVMYMFSSLSTSHCTSCR
jgi:hypothetical protein